MSLLQLVCMKVREKLADSSLSPGHGRALLGLPTEEDQEEISRSVIRKGLSVRETERLVRRWGKGKPASATTGESDDFERKQLRDQLRTFLSTKVHICRSGRRGKIEIEFYSLAELQRLVDLILGEKGV